MKKSKSNKKSRKTVYMPILANGGGGNFSDYYNSQGYENIGTASAGVHASGINNMGGTGVDTYGEQGYNAMMSGVSKAGPIGSVIGGVSAIGDAIGKPIRKSTEAIDPNTGKYKNIQKAEMGRTAGSFFNPLKTGMDAANDPNATNFEKIGSFIGGPGAQRSITRRREGERNRAIERQRHEEFKQIRLAEEPQSTMQFGNGGDTSLFGGKSKFNLNLNNPQSGLTSTHKHGRKGSFILPDYDKNKMSYGQVYGQNIINDPYTKEAMGYEQYKIGHNSPSIAYFEPDQVERVGNKNIMPGSETPINANGGQLKEARYNKDVTYYGGGYTHEDSPINGTPIGSKGLVEKGEVRYKDYIFSDRF